ncbi:MAG: twin-arginine translocase TatA/TatE family subunit [Candidatus Acidiferrales bacterium]
MLSIPHLIVIFVVALVVFGPEKLPELARNFGKVMAEFRRATGDLRTTFEGHMRDLEREAETRRIAAVPPAATAASPAASGPQPVPSEPARAVPSPTPDPPAGIANEAAVKAGVVDPMQDPYLAGFDFEIPQPPDSPPKSTAEKAPEPVEKSPEKVPQK